MYESYLENFIFAAAKKLSDKVIGASTNPSDEDLLQTSNENYDNNTLNDAQNTTSETLKDLVLSNEGNKASILN